MPTPALMLFIATLLPLASFLLLIFFGKRLGSPLAGWVATALIGAAMGCSFAGMISWYEKGQIAGMSWGPGDKPIHLAIRWIPVASCSIQEHPGFLDLDLDVDSLTIAMFNMVTLVALLSHVYALGYMRREKLFPRFFAFLSLACFAILGLSLSGNLLQWLMFIEIAGLASFSLIGFWHEKAAARRAAVKAFAYQRLGSIGLLVGIGIVFHCLGGTSLLQMDQWLGSAGTMDEGDILHLPSGINASATLLTIMAVALFFGAMAVSAQFPLHVWLSDAMESPSPASALLHAAIFVGSGVYMVGRLFPVLTPDAKLFIAIVGLITLGTGALCALAQSDVKKLLSCAVFSQLGFMMLAIGIGSWTGGLFHLITSSFFLTLLVLAAGSVVRATQGQRDLFQLGGYFKKMPLTAGCFGVGVLAISQTPLFSGYYSGGIILGQCGAFVTLAKQSPHDSLYRAFFLVPVIFAYLTPFYMTRCWMLIFWGRTRDRELRDSVRESTTQWLPLLLMAGLSILGGSQLLDVKVLLQQSAHETEGYVNAVRDPAAPAFTGFSQAWPVDLDARLANPDESRTAPLMRAKSLEDAGEKLRHDSAAWAFAAGIALAFLFYCTGPAFPAAIVRLPPIRFVHAWLKHRMYFDEMYEVVFVTVAISFCRLLAVFDRQVLERFLSWPFKILGIGRDEPIASSRRQAVQ
jgi:NADH:ubiquinone oxidoreductase subunit 5 (subunit L)/multisubunit Na+/H+ antiporter MnhA subunit